MRCYCQSGTSTLRWCDYYAKADSDGVAILKITTYSTQTNSTLLYYLSFNSLHLKQHPPPPPSSPGPTNHSTLTSTSAHPHLNQPRAKIEVGTDKVLLARHDGTFGEPCHFTSIVLHSGFPRRKWRKMARWFAWILVRMTEVLSHRTYSGATIS